ncbi:MAG TPA: PIG-L family deacetylase [Nitrososphaeraceae archaeon]|jgi:LmbE family N-acetylglucosaminyl deacetylase|nr:PIG-L family deacetylase [Nitrososphaeraceae archaeon]
MDNFNTILVFGAHPDDLEIGMGGTISKLTTLGYKVIMVIATLPNFTSADKKDERKLEAQSSATILGCTTPNFLDLPPEEIIFGRRMVNLIDSLIKKYNPSTVFTQWIGDSHQDHQILTQSVITASRDINNLYMYETTIPGGITEKSFRPQLYVDITKEMENKKKSLQCFKSQFPRCGPFWIDAIVGRSIYRGYQMNKKYAEAFEIVKTIQF